MSYFDTSVIVAYYVPELSSSRVQDLVDSESQVAISDLVEVELFSALSLRLRIGDLEHSHVQQVATFFTSHLESDLYTRIHLHAGHYHLARDYIARFDLPLKAPDALHLAVASIEDLTLVTADRQLADNAGVLGVGAELITP